MVSKLHRYGCRITQKRYLLLKEDQAPMYVKDVLAAAQALEVRVSDLLREPWE